MFVLFSVAALSPSRRLAIPEHDYALAVTGSCSGLFVLFRAADIKLAPNATAAFGTARVFATDVEVVQEPDEPG